MSAPPPLPPGPRGYPLVGVMPKIWRDPLRFFSEVSRDHGPVARVGLGKFTLFLLSGPEPIQRVLQDNAGNYWKGEGLAAAKPLMGEGLATSEGEFWQRQRRLCQPSFQRKRLAELIPTLEAALVPTLEAWAQAAARGKPVEAVADVSALTQRLIFGGLFGGSLSEADQRALASALVEANLYVNAAAWTLIPIPAGIPTPRRIRFRRALATLDRVVFGRIKARRERGEPAAGAPQDLLDRLLLASDEAGGMDDRQARDEIMTAFVAGHDTTAGAIVWTLLLLAQHPEVAERVASEAASLGPAPAPEERIRGLTYTEQVLRESMRVYPPAWVFVRTPYQDDVLGGFSVPKGSPVLISQWVVHRHPGLWSDPLRFDPERWAPGAPPPGKFTYFPYGAGRRLCIGKPFADLSILLTLARILERFRLQLVGKAPRPQPGTTLRPGGRLRLRLTPRS
ncbi:MAG: cytochrome P450 [Planctomycetes bacterium]|nr:cytochrome P450 [Planctomycetota bacterium]